MILKMSGALQDWKKSRKKRKGWRDAFTLLEFLAIAIIIGILAAIAIPKFKGASLNAIKSSMESDARNAISAEESLYGLTQSYESATVSGGTSGAQTAIDTNYPNIQLVASPGNTVTVTATDTDGDGLNDCFTVTVTNPKLSGQVYYDSCGTTPSPQYQSSTS
jgi:type II secretory pathway pseudopilin PulG